MRGLNSFQQIPIAFAINEYCQTPTVACTVLYYSLVTCEASATERPLETLLEPKSLMQIWVKRLTRPIAASKLFLPLPDYFNQALARLPVEGRTSTQFEGHLFSRMKKIKKSGFCSIKACFFALLLSLTCWASGSLALAQNAPEPRREQLLNGLQILYLPRPADANVLLKLRIHSGAAFDMAGKAGTMALLGDALFPDATTREYFTDELGGRLEVTTNYDYINITLTGKSQGFERMVDLLHNALVNTQLNAEAVNRLRDARLKLIKATSIAPASIADRAISARLFGDFPYGRPFAGSTETIARIERADLLFARERFLNSNNATLVLIGGIDERRAMRALRQLLGVWRKSEQIVPATFRQPEKPDARILIVDLPGTETAEVRLAARALSRSDRDYWAATLLALMARDRLQASLPALSKSPFFARQEAHTLPGAFVFGATVPNTSAGDTLAAARNAARSFITIPPTSTELERARSEALSLVNKQAEQTDTLADLWLDRETYKLDSISEQMRVLKNVTAVEIQGAAARLFRDAAFATVVVGPAAQLKSALSGAGEVEIAVPSNSSKAATPSTVAPTTNAPASKPPVAPLKRPR